MYQLSLSLVVAVLLVLVVVPAVVPAVAGSTLLIRSTALPATLSA